MNNEVDKKLEDMISGAEFQSDLLNKCIARMLKCIREQRDALNLSKDAMDATSTLCGSHTWQEIVRVIENTDKEIMSL